MLIGSLKFQDNNYTYYGNIKSSSNPINTAVILTDLHIEDRLNNTTEHRIITDHLRERILDPNYVIGYEQVFSASDKSYTYGDMFIIHTLIDALSFVLNDPCKASEVTIDKTDLNSEGVLEHQYGKETDRYKLSYFSVGGNYESFNMEYDGMELHLTKAPQGAKLKKLREIAKESKKITVSRNLRELSNKTLTFTDVLNTSDLSWYIDPFTGEYKKDYGCIHNIVELAKEVVFPFIKHYWKEVRSGKKEVPFVIDTEGTGLTMYDLSKDNPLRDYMTAIPVSWKTEFGRTIFIRMKYLGNTPTDNVFNFIKELTKEVWDKEDKSVNLFQDVFREIEGCPPMEDFILNRDILKIVGHNVSYDTRAFLTDDVPVWWDHNTLQMAFIMNPTTVKAKIPHLETKVVTNAYGEKHSEVHLIYVNPGNGLKPITKRLFDYEPLELTNILGKGSEGNYHLIKDEEVAKVYGCADADGTLKAYYAMRKMIEENSDLFEKYIEQDMFLTNIWARFDYKGIKVDHDGLSKVAKHAISDLDIIHDFTRKYVGQIVSIKSQSTVLRRLYLDNKISKDDYNQRLSEIACADDASYDFNFTPGDKTKVLYDIMGYPKLKTNKKDKKGNLKEITASVDALKTLLTYKTKSKVMLESVMSSDGENVLIDKDEFNKYKYPLAYLFKLESDLNKDITGFYNPLLNNNMEGKLFADTRMNGTETRRIIHRFQTVKKHVKKFFKPYDETYMCYDQDMSQIEYREMAYASGQWNMVERLINLEADFHTEAAAMLTGQQPHQISHEFRSSMKCVNFGIPYGLGPKSLCITMYGEYNEVNLAKTNKMLNMFYDANPAVMKMLYAARDKCLEPVDFTDDFKRFNGFVDYVEEKEVDQATGKVNIKYKEVFKPVGRACNNLGFWRLFDLSRKDNSTIAAYRRAAGNEPIQGSASDKFRTCLIRYYKALCANGLKDKVIWHIPIHDEIIYSVKKDVHPYVLYKIMRDACMLEIPEFPGKRYFTWGMGTGDSWKVAKSDDAEAPQMFMDYAIEMYDKGIWNYPSDNYPAMIQEHIRYWEREVRIPDEVKSIIPDFTDTLDIDYFIKNLVNYKVREYILPFEPKAYAKKGKELTMEKHLAFGLIGWLDELEGNYKVKLGDKVSPVEDYMPKEESLDTMFDDLLTDFDVLDAEDGELIEVSFASDDDQDSFYNMDADDIISSVIMLNELTGDEDDEEYSPYLKNGYSKEGNVLKLSDELKAVNTGFGNVTLFSGVFTIKLPSDEAYATVSKILSNFKSSGEDGFSLVYKVKDTANTSEYFGGYTPTAKYRTIRGGKVSQSLTQTDIDGLVDTVINGTVNVPNGINSNFKVIGNKAILIREFTNTQLVRLSSIIKKYTTIKELSLDRHYSIYLPDGKLLVDVPYELPISQISNTLTSMLKEVNIVG